MAKVQTVHRDVTAMIERWERCRDVVSGTDAIKGKGVSYLPALEGGESSYGAYKARAMFYPAGERTVTGLSGMLFGKAPTLTRVPTSHQDDFNDVTLDGVSLLSFAGGVAREVLTVGRCGVLIEMPTTGSSRPYWVPYLAEQIINWRMQRVNGVQTLTLVVLEERVDEALDEFELRESTRYRVLRLQPTAAGNHVYTSQVYVRSVEQKNEWVGEDAVQPTRKGQPLDFIPFVCLTPDAVSCEVAKPPLLDLFDVTISHYRTEADREHGAHYTALPTAVTIGAEMKPGEQLAIGSGTAWDLPMGASAMMLEFSGAGLAALKDILEEKRLLMVTLGARMLETQKNTAEAAQTVRLRHAGERSALQVLAEVLSLGITLLVRWHLYWSGMDYDALADVAVQLNPDTMDELSATDMQALITAWQAGAVSHKTVFYNLQWGEWTRPGVEFEQELRDIAREADGKVPADPFDGGTTDDEDEDDDGEDDGDEPREGERGDGDE